MPLRAHWTLQNVARATLLWCATVTVGKLAIHPAPLNLASGNGAAASLTELLMVDAILASVRGSTSTNTARMLRLVRCVCLVGAMSLIVVRYLDRHAALEAEWPEQFIPSVLGMSYSVQSLAHTLGGCRRTVLWVTAWPVLIVAAVCGVFGGLVVVLAASGTYESPASRFVIVLTVMAWVGLIAAVGFWNLAGYWSAMVAVSPTLCSSAMLMPLAVDTSSVELIAYLLSAALMASVGFLAVRQVWREGTGPLSAH